MKNVRLAACAIALAIPACQQDTSKISQQNEAILAKLDDLAKKVDEVSKGAGARPSRPQPRRPDPSTVYSVPIDGSPFKGPEHAKITIVKAFEYACPFCDRVRPTLDQLMKDYSGDIKVVYKHYVVHPQVATIPAKAACAAHKFGKFPNMTKLIWEKGFRANRNLSADNMVAIAKELGINEDKFKAELNGEACAKSVQKDQAQLASVGVRGTPAFFINGRFLSGAQPIGRFKAIIDEEIKKADAAISKGAKLENYYAESVIKKGKKRL